MAGKSELLSPQGSSSNRKGTDAEEGASSSSKAGKPSATTTKTSAPLDRNIKDGNETLGGFLKSVNFDPTPNPMGDLLQPTYHFSFYLDTDIESQQGSDNVFVIAETGLTGMNLQDVEIESFVGPNIRTRNATATSITIKIYEPFGAQLPDLLFQAAARMSINNYLKAPWFLKLKLHGYDEDGKHVQVGDSWTWKLVLIDIASQISESGSVHTITAMPQAEVALNNQYCMVPSSVNSSGTTVGDALQNIIKSMNDNIIQTYGNSNPPFLEFVIKDEPYPYDTKVGVSRPFDHKIVSDSPQDGNQRNDIGFGTTTTHFAPGTDIPAVVDKLMASTDSGIQIARLSREKPNGNGPDLEPTIRDVSSFVHRVDTQVEYLGYDAVLGDYAKRITFIVKPFQSMRLLTSMGRAMKFDKEGQLNRQKAQHAVNRVFMTKQYDYLFTGLNTEIEKFDINVNFRWAVSVPVVKNWNNISGSTARMSDAAQAQDSTLQLQQSKNDIDSLKGQRQILDDAKAKNNGVEDDATQKKRAELDAQISTAEQRNQELRTIAGQARDKVNAAQAVEIEKRRKLNGASTRVIDGEDTVYDNAQGKDVYAGAGGGMSSFLPITIVQDPDAPVSAVRSGTPNDNNPNKSIYGALLNQLYGNFDGNLQNLELEIRGDPYWIGPGSTGKPYNEQSTTTTPNWMNGEHIFVFRFKLPQGYDQSTGTVNLSKDDQGRGGSTGKQDEKKPASGGDSNIFTGFYAAINVTNHFREGRFTQTLNATRIQGWTYENIIEGRENIDDGETNFSNSNAPTPPVSTGGLEAGQRGANGTGGRGAGARIPTGNLTDQQLLAITLVGEAGGEGVMGMQAVGNVIMNRKRTNYGGNGTVSEVILAPKQFSMWNGQTVSSVYASNSQKSTYDQAYTIAGQLLNNQAGDLTHGATSYLNVPLTAKINGGKLPSWYYKGTITRKIGNHTFLKGV